MKVSVKDELPDRFKEVWVYRDGEPRVKAYRDYGSWWADVAVCPVEGVTHWEKIHDTCLGCLGWPFVLLLSIIAIIII